MGDFDFTQTAAQLGSQAAGHPKASRALNFPNRGPNGTIAVAKEYSPPNKPLSWVFESITHEEGNIIAARINPISQNESKYGDPNGISDMGGPGDTDTGAKLEKCVHSKVKY